MLNFFLILSTIKMKLGQTSALYTNISDIFLVIMQFFQMLENTDQNNSEYGHFLRSDENEPRTVSQHHNKKNLNLKTGTPSLMLI